MKEKIKKSIQKAVGNQDTKMLIAVAVAFMLGVPAGIALADSSSNGDDASTSSDGGQAAGSWKREVPHDYSTHWNNSWVTSLNMNARDNMTWGSNDDIIANYSSGDDRLEFLGDLWLHDNISTEYLNGVCYLRSSTGSGTSGDPYNASAIQTALDAGYNTIILPPTPAGTPSYWRLRDEDAPIEISGVGITVMSPWRNGALIFGEDGFDNNTAFFNVTGNRDTIKNLRIQSQKDMDYKNGGIGIDMRGVEFKLLQTEIRDFHQHCLNINSSERGIGYTEITGNYLLSADDSVIQIDEDAYDCQDILIQHNHLAGASGIIKITEGVSHVDISNNRFHGASGTALELRGCSEISIHGVIVRSPLGFQSVIKLDDDNGVKAHNISISNVICTADGSTGYGMTLNDCRNVTVSNSQFTGCDNDDIYLSATAGENISFSNVIFDSTNGINYGQRTLFNGVGYENGDPTSNAEWNDYKKYLSNMGARVVDYSGDIPAVYSVYQNATGYTWMQYNMTQG